jgi:hypothetical protein
MDRPPTTPPPADQPLTHLRGAGVEFNRRRVVQVITALVLVALAILSVAFFVAGAHRNAQINDLRTRGVPVDVTVTGCAGLLAGSGSNNAGFVCTGRFTLDGHHRSETLPGSSQLPVGSVLHYVTVPDQPGLIASARSVASEHASAKVFILPSVFLVALVCLGAAVVLRMRRRDESPATP